MGFIDALWKYLLVSAPYLLIGLVVGGFIHQFLSVEKVKKWLGGSSFLSVVKAALIGLPLPLCSCSVIPISIALRKSGASKAATSSFLIATPESGVDSISMTYGLMDLPMTIIRPVAAFISAFVAGILQILFNKEETTVEHNKTMGHEGHACHNKDSHCESKKLDEAKPSVFERIKMAFEYGLGDLVNDIALWLGIGILAGALIDFLVPANFFEQLSPTQARLAIFAVGIPLYICASASTPIAVSLILKGMSPGVALILLLVGPATNISNIAVLQKYIGVKGVVLNIIAIILVALGFSYLTDFLYSNYFPMNFAMASVHEHWDPNYLSIALGAFLGFLILKGIYVEEIRPRLRRKSEAAKGCCH